MARRYPSHAYALNTLTLSAHALGRTPFEGGSGTRKPFLRPSPLRMCFADDDVAVFLTASSAIMAGSMHSFIEVRPTSVKY
jgi:hypothetical protein